MSENGMALVVRTTEKHGAGRGITCLLEAVRRALGVFSGETVVIEGSRETVVKTWPACPGAAAGEALVDAGTRVSAGVKIGDSVHVRRATVESAWSVTLAGPSTFEWISMDYETIEEAMKAELRNHPVHEGDHVHAEHLGGAALAVNEIAPRGVVRVTNTTTVSVTTANSKDASEAVRDAIRSMTGSDGGGDDGSRGRATGVTYEDTGGPDDELGLVREMIELPSSELEVLVHLDIEPPKGVPFHDSPGTGKTLIVKTVVNEVDASFTAISGPGMLSKYKGESEEKLREVFQSTRENAPAIIFFDEIDSIAPKRNDSGDLENRVVGQLLSFMDKLSARSDVVVIGATNRVDNLGPMLRRGGRFDREVEIGAPNKVGRRKVLDVHTRWMPLAGGADIDQLVSRTHGFTSTDLESLAKEAAMTAPWRVRRESGGRSGDGGGRAAVADMIVMHIDFESAVTAVEPSAMREYVARQSTEGFGGVSSLDDVERILGRAVTWPLTYVPLFETASTDPPTGLLLHGSSGIGKTMLARAIAAESGVNSVHVVGPELLDRCVGESEKFIRGVSDRAQ